MYHPMLGFHQMVIETTLNTLMMRFLESIEDSREVSAEYAKRLEIQLLVQM